MTRYTVSLAFVVTTEGATPETPAFYRIKQEYTHLDMSQLLVIERAYAETILNLVEKGEAFAAQLAQQTKTAD